VPLALLGQVTLNGDSITNTFVGIPDLPLSRFELAIAGGGNTHLLSNTRSLCGRKTPPLARATLLSHSGRTAHVNAPLAVRGCPPGSSITRGGRGRPRATLSLRFRHRRGLLAARFVAARKGPRLKRTRLTLPKRLRTGARRGKLPRGLKVTADGRRLGRKRVRLHGHTLDVRLKGRGARSVRVRWSAIKPRRKLARRLKHRPRLTFVARLTDARRRTTRLRLTVRPAVRP
jgi:hypothetical protein